MRPKRDTLATDFRYRGAILAAGMVAAATVTGQPQADTERQLEAAIHREVGLGDLTGAIDGYRALAVQSAEKAVTGRALLQMGLCLARLGRREEARDAYRRAAAFPEVAGMARARLAQLDEITSAPR